MKTLRITIPKGDETLFARLELPANNKVKQYAIFAHCFTCNSDLGIVRNISQTLTLAGIAVLRFDFTGLGRSSGEFADTNFSGNVDDLIAVSEYLSEHYSPPGLLIGHSLGGAAVIMAAKRIKHLHALVTIGAPSEPAHVTHLFGTKHSDIEQKGEAEVHIGGRPFRIRKQFIDDLHHHNAKQIVSDLRVPYLILHSPQDQIVSIDNAAELYQAAHHPKSFISLDGADHLISSKEDARYVAGVISAWAERYLPMSDDSPLSTEGEQVVVHLNTENKFTSEVFTEKHHFIADEPASVGGSDLGPSPYELLNSAVGTCTAMTIKMYADRKKWDLQEVFVYLSYAKKHADELMLDDRSGRIEYIHKKIRLVGDLDREQRTRLLEIASKCPVHRTVQGEVHIDTVELN